MDRDSVRTAVQLVLDPGDGALLAPVDGVGEVIAGAGQVAVAGDARGRVELRKPSAWARNSSMVRSAKGVRPRRKVCSPASASALCASMYPRLSRNTSSRSRPSELMSQGGRRPCFDFHASYIRRTSCRPPAPAAPPPRPVPPSARAAPRPVQRSAADSLRPTATTKLVRLWKAEGEGDEECL